jgi:hypothetical protein
MILKSPFGLSRFNYWEMTDSWFFSISILSMSHKNMTSNSCTYVSSVYGPLMWILFEVYIGFELKVRVSHLWKPKCFENNFKNLCFGELDFLFKSLEVLHKMKHNLLLIWKILNLFTTVWKILYSILYIYVIILYVVLPTLDRATNHLPHWGCYGGRHPNQARDKII